MHIFARATNNARAPISADDEPAGAIFAGTPSQVAIYLAAHMPKQPDTIALLTAELAHLAQPRAAQRFTQLCAQPAPPRDDSPLMQDGRRAAGLAPQRRHA